MTVRFTELDNGALLDCIEDRALIIQHESTESSIQRLGSEIQQCVKTLQQRKSVMQVGNQRS